MNNSSRESNAIDESNIEIMQEEVEPEEKFLKRLTKYLNKRYGKKLMEEGKEFFLSKAGDENFIATFKDAKWSVSTGSGVFPHVEGVEDEIIVWSRFKGNPVDISPIESSLVMY